MYGRPASDRLPGVSLCDARRFTRLRCHAGAPKPARGVEAGPAAGALPKNPHTQPITPVPAVLPVPSVPTRQAFYHRGFSLEIRRAPSGYAFSVRQGEHALHTSRAAFGTPGSADRAARQFVDDALGAFDFATQALEA